MKFLRPKDFLAFCYWACTMPAKLVCKVLAPIAVLFVDRTNHPIWGIEDAKIPVSYWEAANPFGNACHNLFLLDQCEFDTWSDSGDWSLEKREGRQWRFRRSKDGWYISFRVTWGEPRKSDGKREFYAGWTMNDEKNQDGKLTMRPTLQFRFM